MALVYRLSNDFASRRTRPLQKSAFLLGIIGVFQFGPVLLLSLFVDVLIDRLPKRSVLLVAQGIFTIQSLLLTVFVWSGHVTYGQVAVLSVIYGITQAFDLPVRQSFVIDLVGWEDLMNAISINSTAFNLSRILGPVFAGAIIGGVGVNALAALASAVIGFLWLMFLNMADSVMQFGGVSLKCRDRVQ
jgi:MFS family permease